MKQRYALTNPIWSEVEQPYKPWLGENPPHINPELDRVP